MEDKMKELTVLISKTDRAMEMTRNTQTEIDDMRKDLMEEVRPMMVEKRKEEIAQKESSKSEFDEMTKQAILRAKAEIIQIREQAEKEYQDKLIENVEKQKRIADKLKSIEGREQDAEKLSMARNAAEKALATVKEEMKNYENRHFTVIRPKLAEFETKIGDYAIELGIEEELNKVGLEKSEKEKTEPTSEPTPAPKSTPVQTSEPTPAPKSTPVQTSEPTPVPKSTPVPTPEPTPVPNPTYEIEDIAEGIFEKQYAYKEGYDEEGKVKPNARIESIEFKFESGNPQYIIITKGGNILTANVNAENKKLYKPVSGQRREEIDTELGFKGAYKLADPFLLKFLKDYDKTNGTSEYKKYVKMLEDGSKKKFLKEEEPEIMLHYDMNGKESAKMDKESIKNLQKIAKKNNWYEIATYDKGKGWLARFIEKMRRPKLSAENKETAKVAEPDKTSEEKGTAHKEFVENLQKEAQKDSNEQSIKKGEAKEFTIEEVKEETEEVR